MSDRRAGILLHPTSLPGPYGIGDIGPSARRWLTWLEAAGQRIWQFLPLVPVGGSGSPYSSPSGFARSPLLLSPDDLVADGWLDRSEKRLSRGDPYEVDYDQVRVHRRPILRAAADRVRTSVDLDRWAASREWASNWALFAALTEVHGHDWREWPEALRDRDADALAEARDRNDEARARHLALQWLFDQQWARVREEAARRGIALWGDLPIFVGADACDVWAHRDLFRLDGRGQPVVVSGVPPDDFSEDGQLWGHPLFDNAAHAASGYHWWTDRVSVLLELVDTIRLDHFRGLEATWEVPVGARSAREGRWIPGLGKPVLDAMKARLSKVPLVAEDLGVITPSVHALRDAYDLPGMAILQFAFAGLDAKGAGAHPYLPYMHRTNLVVYTGTHDNDTTVGWYLAADAATRDHVQRYLHVDGRDIAWDMLRCAYRSPADTAIAPMQDALSLDGRARMNVPGCADGNWHWRMGPEAMNLVLARKLRDEAHVSGRAGL